MVDRIAFSTYGSSANHRSSAMNLTSQISGIFSAHTFPTTTDETVTAFTFGSYTSAGEYSIRFGVGWDGRSNTFDAYVAGAEVVPRLVAVGVPGMTPAAIKRHRVVEYRRGGQLVMQLIEKSSGSKSDDWPWLAPGGPHGSPHFGARRAWSFVRAVLTMPTLVL